MPLLAARADSELVQVADVIVHEARWSVPVAAALASITLRLLPGCAIVAVGLTGGGWLLHGRDGQTAVVQPAGDLPRSIQAVYSLMVRAAEERCG